MQPSQLGARYEQMLDSLPASEPDILSAARALELDGQAERACALLEHAAAHHPSANLCKTLAALHLKHQRYAACAHVIEKVVEQHDSDIPSLLLLAQAQIEGGEQAQAKRTLERAEGLGASKLRVFKLERRLDPEFREARDEPPSPPTRASADDTDPERPSHDSTTEPEAFSGGIAPLADPDDPTTDSAVFEDGSFSSLSSIELAEGAAALREEDTPAIFDTLVDGYQDDAADRSFDKLLVDLGVPIDQQPADPDVTAALPRMDREEVASQWGIPQDEPETAGPDEETAAINLDELGDIEGLDRSRPSDLSDPSMLRTNGPLSDPNVVDEDDFAGGATEVISSDRPQEPAAGARGPKGPPSRPDPPDNRTRPARPALKADAAPTQDRDGRRRPLPPSVRRRDGQRGASGRRREGRGRPGPPPSADAGDDRQQQRADHASDPDRQTDAAEAEALILGQPPKVVAGAVAAVVVLLAIALVAAASSSAATAVQEPLLAAREAKIPDTYRGYLAAERALDKAASAESFVGQSFDETLGGLGLMERAQQARREALIERAVLAAMIEYRYEQSNSRQSTDHLVRAEAVAPADPRVELARAYQLLTRMHLDEAIGILRTINKNFTEFSDASAVLVLARLEAGSLQRAAKAAEPLRELEKPSVFHHFVLAKLDAALSEPAADGRYRHIIETISPGHISARIERSYTMRADAAPEGASKQARRLLDEVLGSLRDQASPMQLAKASIAIGALHRADGSTARAEEQFRKAINALPSRSEVYAPLIELYAADGRLERAIELVEDAASRGAQSPQLVFQRARLLRLTGEPKQALTVLQDQDKPTARALWLEGVAQIELGQLAEATEAFAQSESKSDDFAAARAWRLLAQELGSTDTRSQLSEELDELLDEASEDPSVLRAGALAAMHVAQHGRTRKQRAELLSRADKLIERALGAGANEAVLRYDLCRLRILDGDAEDASVHCAKARRTNDQYLPGLLVFADLELRRGNFDDALELLSELADKFPDDPRVSQLTARAHLRLYEVDEAEDEINRWAGTAAAKTRLHRLVEGERAFARERYTSALGYFKRAHEQAPDDALAAIHYAHTLTRLGDHERAEELVRAHLNDLEWGPVAWLVFGELRRRQGRFSDAKENLELALRKFDDIVTPPWRIAQAYTQLAHAWADRYGWNHRYVGRYLYRGAQRGDAEFPPLNTARATYHLEKRRPNRQKAAAALEKVVARTPSNCSVLGTLLELYDEMGAAERYVRTEDLISKHCED